MAEKKETSAKKTTVKKTTSPKKDVAKKTTTTKKATSPKKETVKKAATTKKAAPKKTTTKKTAPKKETVKEIKKEIVVEEEKKEKKECKLSKWFRNLSLEQIIVTSVIIIAVLLLVLIGVTAKNTKTKNGKDIIAKVGEKVITADDLYNEIKEQAGQNFVLNMVDEYILEKEYKTTKEIKKTVSDMVQSYKDTYGEQYNDFLEYNGIKDEKELRDVLTKQTKLMTAIDDYVKESISEKDMKKYYKNNIYGDIKAKHILISFDTKEDATEEDVKKAEEKALKKAEEIIEKIKNGEKFDDLAKKYSDDTGSKEKGGDLGYFNTGAMVKEFEDAAFKLKVNEYTTKPVKTQYGYHIIMKTDEKKKPSYEKAKNIVLEKMMDEKKQNDPEINQKALDSLRKKYDFKIVDKKIKKEYESSLK